MVTFGDNGKGKIIGIDNISITPSTCIESILLVDGFKYNLLRLTNYVIEILMFLLNHLIA